jgi:hypothetical protein
MTNYIDLYFFSDIKVNVLMGNTSNIKAEARVVQQFKSRAANLSRLKIDTLIEYNSASNAKKPKMSDILISPNNASEDSGKLIHAVTMGANERREFEIVQKSIYKMLTGIKDLGIRTVNCPLLNSEVGSGKLSIMDSTKAILSAIDKFSKRHPDYKLEFNIIVGENNMVGQAKVIRDIVHDAINKILYKNVKPPIGHNGFNFEAWIEGFEHSLKKEVKDFNSSAKIQKKIKIQGNKNKNNISKLKKFKK